MLYLYFYSFQLQEENTRLNKDIGTQLDQIKALDMVRQKDREDMIQSISEKSALIENMRVQIEKLEQSQLVRYCTIRNVQIFQLFS